MFKTYSDTKLFFGLTLTGLGIYFLSFIGYSYPIVNTILFAVILIAALYFSLRKLEYGVLFVIFELMLGVKGYLFSINLFGFPLSLRLALFVLVFAVWLIGVLRKKFDPDFVTEDYFVNYALFTLMLIVGMITGVLYGNDIKNVFFDANGYFFLAFIFPLYSVVKNAADKKRIFTVFVAGAFALTLFSLFVALEYTIFHQDSRPDLAGVYSTELTLEGTIDNVEEKISHSVTGKGELLDSFSLSRNFENQKPPIYRWTQDVSVAEISYLGGPFFRVFSPGQIVTFFIFVLSLFFVFKKYLKRPLQFDFELDVSPKFWWLIGSVSLFTIILGFSRSLWIGTLFAFLFFVVSLPVKRMFRVGVVWLLALVLLIFGLKFFSPDAFDLLSSRVTSIVNPTSESSGSNRINVLAPALQIFANKPVFGNGFGTTVEYPSVVPEKYGTIRVFAFEWSYIDTLIEIGLFGLLLYVVLILKVIKKLAKSSFWVFAVVLLCLLVVNVTTPYLNHPLGIGMIILSFVLLKDTQKPELHEKNA